MKFLEDFRDAIILWLMVLALVLLIICIGIFGASLARADMVCVPVGQYFTCFHQGGHQTIQTPLGPNYGAIIGPKGTTPYAIVPAPTTSPVVPVPAPLIILPPRPSF